MIAELLSGATLPEVTILKAPVFAAALMLAAGYGSAAAILRHAGFDASLRRTSDVVLLLVLTIISSGLVACGFVAAYAVTGVVPWPDFAEAVFQYWVGDAIGIVVLAPPLLLLNERIEGQTAANRGGPSFRLAEFAAQGLAIVAALAAVFSGMGHPLELFYLLFLPLIWIATRHGLRAASCAVLVIQIGLIAGLEIHGNSELTVRAVQLLMFALAATGLMLGATVSERWRLSKSLVESEGRRTAILNAARDGVLTIDSHGRIQSINPAVETLFSRSSEALIGQDLCEFVYAGPDLLHRLGWVARLPVGEARCWELDARSADGGAFPIELSVGQPDQSDTDHYTVVIRDISARREAEGRARKHQAELAHVSRVSLAGEMAAGLAHELSQPLTAISAYARGCLRLMDGPAPAPALLHEGIAEVVQQAERAGNVLDRLREFVRGGEGQRAPIALEPVIDAAIGFTRIEATQQGVEIEARINPGLPAVLADRIQLEQVLLNLLRNAMDAMEAANTEQRSIVVEARHRRRHSVEISVADSGPGVAAEVTDTIFEPFVTTKALGMGMGLSISRSIVESHGGRLLLAQSVGSGAIFAFDLPTADAEASADAG
jgi:two-component system sensor kinase FixL